MAYKMHERTAEKTGCAGVRRFVREASDNLGLPHLMKHFALVFRLLVLGYLAYLLMFLATGYEPVLPGFRPPFAIWLVDTINLYIHEAGHFFLRPFGQYIHVLGGSLMQVLIPAVFLVVTWRQSPWQIGYAGFWVGENMVNVSVYIQDAPFRKLHLIGKGLIHDWWWLLGGEESVSAPLSEAVFVLGIAVCGTAIAGGVFYAIKAYREADAPPAPSPLWSRQFPGRAI